jgi:hypothetical protein
VKGEEMLLAGVQDPGLQLQLTPEPAPLLLESFVTVAVSRIVPFTCTAIGDKPDGPATITAIGGGGPTVMVAIPLFVGSAFDAAVTVTGRVAALLGSETGAV